jgi:GDP-mannose 6-dehydrogenase
VFCSDTKLNISPRYLRSGFAFGGSCLPKDLRALTHAARIRGVALPMLENVLASNRHQIDRAVQLVMATQPRTVGLVGLAFKPGTDDMRESPLVELAERLLGKGMRLAIHDPHVQTNRLVGRNKAFVDQVFPHLADLLREDFEMVAGSDVVVLGHRQPREVVERILGSGKTVVDLTGECHFPVHKGYHSIV